jgi:hypothetical protein
MIAAAPREVIELVPGQPRPQKNNIPIVASNALQSAVSDFSRLVPAGDRRSFIAPTGLAVLYDHGNPLLIGAEKSRG